MAKLICMDRWAQRLHYLIDYNQCYNQLLAGCQRSSFKMKEDCHKKWKALENIFLLYKIINAKPLPSFCRISVKIPKIINIANLSINIFIFLKNLSVMIWNIKLFTRFFLFHSTYLGRRCITKTIQVIHYSNQNILFSLYFVSQVVIQSEWLQRQIPYKLKSCHFNQYSNMKT